MCVEPPVYSTLFKSHSRVAFLKCSPGETESPVLLGNSCHRWLALQASHVSHPATSRSTDKVQQGGNLLPPGVGAVDLRPSCSYTWVFWLEKISKDSHSAGRDCTVEQHLPCLHSVMLIGSKHVGWSC